MKRGLLAASGIALALTLLILAARAGAGHPAFDPAPSPENPDPAGTLAFQMLLRRRGAPVQIRTGLPEEPGPMLLWFAAAPGRYAQEELDAVLSWIRGGGHLLLVCGGTSAAPSSLLGELGLGFEATPFSEAAPAQTSPFESVSLRPAAFSLERGGARVRGMTEDNRPCWVSGTLGDGTWDALADSYPFENGGLAEGGNARFALAMAGAQPWLDSSLFEPDDPTAQGSEPLLWGAVMQVLLLGASLLFLLRRLGPALEPRAPAGSLRLRAGIARALARRRSPRELLELEAAGGSYDGEERARLRALAKAGEMAAAYRIVRRKEMKT